MKGQAKSRLLRCVAQSGWAALEPQGAMNFHEGLGCGDSLQPLVFTAATKKKCFWNPSVKVNKGTVRKRKKQKLGITQWQCFQKQPGNVGA